MSHQTPSSPVPLQRVWPIGSIAVVLLMHALVFGSADAQGVASSADVTAAFLNATWRVTFQERFALTVLSQDTSTNTLVFRFTGSNATTAFNDVNSMTDASRRTMYGITSWSVEVSTTTTTSTAPTSTTTAAAGTTTTTTTTLAPPPPATGSSTSAPVDPASANIQYRLVFDIDGALVYDNVVTAVASVLSVPSSRLDFSQIWTVPTADAANEARLIFFKVKPQPQPVPEGASTTTGEYATVLAVNTRAGENQNRMFTVLSGLRAFYIVPNVVPYTIDQAAAEGSETYMKEKLNFMGVLIAAFVIIVIGTAAGWIHTLNLAEKDLELQRAKQAVDDSTPGSPTYVGNTTGSPTNHSRKAHQPAKESPSPTRGRRSVSFHHTTNPTSVERQEL